MKLRLLLVFLTLLPLQGCMMVYGAMEAFSEHGIGGVLPNSRKANPYSVGMNFEYGKIYKQDYGQAYNNYLIADYVGDIRAKEKLLSL